MDECKPLLSGSRVWVTSEYMHSGVREDGARILKKLMVWRCKLNR